MGSSSSQLPAANPRLTTAAEAGFFSPFFAVPFLSVLIAPNQFLRQCMMLQCATGMPVGTDLYNIFTDHFVSYESEILSGGFIS